MTLALVGSDPIVVGDVWECYRGAHKGWRIRITKVTQSAVMFDRLRGGNTSKAESNPRRNFLPDYVLRRSYVRVQFAKEHRPMTEPDVAREGVTSNPTDPEKFRICSGPCGLLKPIEDFDRIAGRGGLHPSGQRYKKCHACLVQARAAGIRARVARGDGWGKNPKRAAAASATVENGQLVVNNQSVAAVEREAAQRGPVFGTLTPSEVAALDLPLTIAPPEPPRPDPAPLPPDPTPTTPPPPLRVVEPRPARPEGSLAAQLLELAAQADLVEHPPAYRELYSALDAALRVGTEAGAVFVVPADNYLALQIALESARRDFDAPPAEQPPNGRPPESNWRQILRDMNVRTPEP